MKHIIRLTYASTATFQQNQSGGIEAEVARILMQSRANNAHSEIGGVLHYGNGFFFQCLEGESNQVKATYAKIRKDKRHEKIQLLSVNDVSRRVFSDWSMKYMPIESTIKSMLEKFGHKSFNPYLFDQAFINQLLIACIKGIDPTENQSFNDLGPHTIEEQSNSILTKLKNFFKYSAATN